MVELAFLGDFATSLGRRRKPLPNSGDSRDLASKKLSGVIGSYSTISCVLASSGGGFRKEKKRQGSGL
jgi:hypothetical protein